MNQTFKIVINWSKPQDLTSCKNDLSQKRGIYQITRVISSGSSELIYIGLVKGDTRSFGQRIGEHLHSNECIKSFDGEMLVRFGTFCDTEINTDDDLYEILEGALIYQHPTMCNKSKRSYYTKNNEYLIHNIGDIGMLLETVDTKKHILHNIEMKTPIARIDNYEDMIANLKATLSEGNYLHLETITKQSPFVCYMVENSQQLWLNTESGNTRRTSFNNLKKYFKGLKIPDERIYIEAIGKYLKDQTP